MLSPRALGTITRIAEKGSYAVNVSFTDLHKVIIPFILVLVVLRILYLKPSSRERLQNIQ